MDFPFSTKTRSICKARAANSRIPLCPKRLAAGLRGNFGAGFTILELLISLSILLLMGVAIYYSLAFAVPKSHAARVIADFNATYAAFRLWMTDTNNFVYPRDNQYPAGPYSSCGEAEPVLSSTDLFSNVLGRAGWNGPYLSKVPRTPWGYEYLYDNDNDTYPTSGSNAGVNFRFVWCNDTEEKRASALLKYIDETLDKGDGRSAGLIRWTTGDEGKADLLMSYTRNAP